jgi:tetratricopeptide (TPR) repeat protein
VVDPAAAAPVGSFGEQLGANDPLARAQAPTRIGPSYEPPARDGYGPEQDWFGEPRFSTIPPTRSRTLRWLVVLVLLGLLGVAGATVGRKYVAMVVRPAPAPAGTEQRVDALLEDGDRALSDGDLETAKESYDKASALAERDPRVLIDLARLDAARADADWLKVRLLPANQPDVVAAAKRQAQQSAQRTLKTATLAADVAPDDPKTTRTKIDALRISGDLAGARALVARVGAIASQAETSYVLAALDLAEDSPNWAAVIDRLKTAAAGEPNPGRARGALVYALARSGDLHEAKAELEKMATAQRPYALVADLRAFVLRASPAQPELADAGNAKREAGAASVALEPRATSEARREEGVAGDYRSLLQQASQASATKNYDRAEQLYRAALAKSPEDTEALAGLGDVARARGNSSLARSYYERLLVNNSHYVPALAALADLKWDSGDRAGAAKLYRDVVDSVSEGPLAQRAQDRIAQAGAAPSPKPPAPRPSLPSAPASTSDVPPEIDTSDLPGFKR